MSCKHKNKPCNKCENGCDPEIKGECVTYSGDTTEFLHIPRGLDLDSIIQGLDTVLSSIQAQIDTIILTDIINIDNTVSITLSGNGASIPITADLNVSAAALNAVIINSDGIYVPQASSAPTTIGTVTLSSNGISLTYTFPHGALPAPTAVVVSPMTADSADISYVGVDATNITINYNVVPLAGTNNLKYSYTVG